jgi:peptidyl-prolyl cis-trans isomerase B (cyclophilin B)
MRVPVAACASVLIVAAAAGPARGQATVRQTILQARPRPTPTAGDILAIRNAARGRDVETVRLAVRVLGSLERPSLIPHLLVSLRHVLPEVRVEAANAVAQAAQGFRTAKPTSGTVTLKWTQEALNTRLEGELHAGVRAALCEAIARLPYTNAADIFRAEQAIVAVADRVGTSSTADRLGIAKGLEALARMHRSLRPAGPAAVELLKTFMRQAGRRSTQDLLRDARVRRLALEALTSAAGLDDEMVSLGAADPDPQVRRLAMRAAAMSGEGMARVHDGLADPAALVRIEALRALRSRGDERTCRAAVAATGDAEVPVALVAIDQLGMCAGAPDAVATLEGFVGARSTLETPRAWHRSAHALVALASAAPDRAFRALPSFVGASLWQVRAYAARAAVLASAPDVLRTLATDPDERVVRATQTAGRAPAPLSMAPPPSSTPPTTADLRRLASPRATITIRDLGRFELALVTAEAPATVVRFVQLAEAGYYDGLTFDRTAPNAIVQAGGRISGAATYPYLEVGTWPHVRGAVGLSMPDTNDAQFFVDLVDNPRFDHQYTVFAQILNGAEVIDQILEGDVIESIVITP